MSKPPPPPDQRPASYDDDDDDEDASLKKELQHAMAVSRHQDERSYYDDSICKPPIGIDDQHTHTTSLPSPFTKMPADTDTSQSIGSSLPNSSFESYTDHSHTTTPSPLSNVNRSSPSSYDESIPNVSAYFLYQNATREHFKSIHPRMSQGELSKYISQRYKSLDPQEKAAWTAQASQANAAKLSASAEKGANALVTPQKTRKRKDPNAPKRAVGAYVFFTKDERPKILEEFKGIKFAEMGKLLGERWRGLDPDEKRKYEMMAAQDRDRLQSELKVYKENQHRLQKAKQHRMQQQMPQLQDNTSPSQGLPCPVVDYVNGYPAYEYSDEFCSDIIKRLSED